MRSLAVCLLAACGRVGFDDPMLDGPAIDAGPCTEPWSVPTEIATGLASPASPSIRDDGLELFLGDGLGDLYVMLRARVTDPFSAAVLLPAPPNTMYLDQEPSISADGLELYFSSYQMGNAFIDVSHRPRRDAPFELAQRTGAFGGGDVASGGLALYTQDFMSPIGVSTRATPGGTFSGFTPLGAAINDASTNISPSISSDERELYFISNRSGVQEIWVARRSDASAPFVTVDRVELVLPAGATSPGSPEISDDGRALYFTIRIGAGYHLMVATRCE